MSAASLLAESFALTVQCMHHVSRTSLQGSATTFSINRRLSSTAPSNFCSACADVYCSDAKQQHISDMHITGVCATYDADVNVVHSRCQHMLVLTVQAKAVQQPYRVGISEAA